MRNVRQAAVLAFASVLGGAPLAAHAQQVHPGETQGLGLTGAKTPDMLKDIAADPYRAPAEPACQTIPAELVALNQVLGVDADQQAPKTSMVNKAGHAIVGAARDMIPYRGEIRFLTQADKKDRQLQDAARAAWARRGFLRGLSANLHCADGGEVDASNAEPLAPPVDTTIARIDLPPPTVPATRAAYSTGPDQPWQLPPPRAADEAADNAAATAAAEPASDLRTVMLRDPEDTGFDRPGR